MNNKKIDFIMCTNNEQHASEAILYINHLLIPETYEVNIIKIVGGSIFSSYNEGMRLSDAKYKVYLHQDVRIIDENFLYVMLEEFENPEVGMMGVVGSSKLELEPWQWDAGSIIETRVTKTYCQHFSETNLTKYVKQIDGLLMATQYDIPWREDLFEGWDIYDCSQCCEFLKAGYKIVVPERERPLCLHDCGMISLSGYSEARKKFIAHYSSMFD